MNEPAGSEAGLAVYGDLAGQRLWQRMVLRKSLRAEGAEDGGLGGAAMLGGVIEDWSVTLCRRLQTL